MSWSGQGRVFEGEVELSLPGQMSAEHMQQAQSASRAVQEIVKSGALGDPENEYTVSISGHANVDHEPTAGWANDHLTIVITQAGGR